MSQEDTQFIVHAEALDIARALEAEWPAMLAAIPAWHPRNEGDPDPSKTDPAPDPKKDDPDPADPKKDDPKPPWGDGDFDPERAWKLIQGVRGDLDKVKAERDDLKGRVQKHEDASKSDQQKLEERATGAEGRATQAEQDAARLRVALRKGLTETQAKRLVGQTEEELEKDADELLESFKTGDDGGQDPARRPKERLRPGAVPDATPDEADPKKLAESVPRRW